MRKIIREFRKDYPTAEISTRGSGHLAISLDGVTVFTSATPSDYRTQQNVRAQIRRALRTKPQKETQQ